MLVLKVFALKLMWLLSFLYSKLIAASTLISLPTFAFLHRLEQREKLLATPFFVEEEKRKFSWGFRPPFFSKTRRCFYVTINCSTLLDAIKSRELVAK